MNKNQKNVAKYILIGLGVVGIVSAVAIAPGLAKALPLLKKVNISRINQEIKRLHKRGLIEIIKRKSGSTTIKLNEEGRKKLARYNIDTLKIEKPKEWDGKWRVIIFDIPVNKNNSRALLRKKIKNLGFYKLQHSVFVYPFPCYEVVRFLREYFGVSAEVEYIEADRIESQDRIIEHFFT